jgi:hypothetical protein
LLRAIGKPLAYHPATAAQDQTGAPKTQDQGATPAEQSKRYEEYLLALKKCQDLQDAAMQKCIEQARQKYNRM